MTPPSQKLAILILDRILDFTVGNFPHEYTPKYACDCAPYIHIAPVLRLCSAWRSAALSKLYNETWWCNYTGCTQCYKAECHNRNLPRGLPLAIATGNTGRVKKLILHWDSATVLDGTAIETIRSSSLGRMTFPSVTSLGFHFTKSSDTRGNGKLDMTENALAFCTEIYRLFPNAQSCQLSQFSGFALSSVVPFVPSLSNGLVSHKSLTDYSLSDYIDYISIPVDRRNLRSLSIVGIRESSPAVELIRRSATTLELLAVQSDYIGVFTQLLCADDDSTVVYPCVHSLELSYTRYHNSREVLNLPSPAGTPFPSLRRLVSLMRYPFKNDVLFRGSEKTLEDLAISLLPTTVSDLAECGIFDASRLPVLKYVCVVFSELEDDAAHMLSTRSLLQLCANARIIKSRRNTCHFDDTGFEIKKFGRNITMLDIPSIRFTTRRMIQLIKALPFLRRLQTGIEITEELRNSDETHDVCIGECRPLWIQRHANDPAYCRRRYPLNRNSDTVDTEDRLRPTAYEEFHTSRYNSFDYLRDYFMDHLDLIYANLEFVAALYTDFYPLSETLTILDYSKCRQDGVELLARSKMAAILLALCPSIRRVLTRWAKDNRFSRAPIHDDNFIEQPTIEQSEQHKQFIARLKSVAV